MNMFWVGVLAGTAVMAVAPGLIKILVFVAGLAFSGLLVRLPGDAHGFAHFHLRLPPLVIVVLSLLFIGIALHFGRLRGLQHLAKAELRGRWATVRGISKW